VRTRAGEQSAVGLTTLDVEVANVASPETTETVTCLVDSGALYSIIPAPVLERLGIRPLTEQVFRLAKGDTIRRRKGGAVFKYNDKIGVADVVFGEPGDASLLGVMSLEAMGLGLDPVRRRLVEIPLLL
jgi:predicted aspartyl protease